MYRSYYVEGALADFLGELTEYLGEADSMKEVDGSLVLVWKPASGHLFLAVPQNCGCLFICGGPAILDTPVFEYHCLWKDHDVQDDVVSLEAQLDDVPRPQTIQLPHTPFKYTLN